MNFQKIGYLNFTVVDQKTQKHIKIFLHLVWFFTVILTEILDIKLVTWRVMSRVILNTGCNLRQKPVAWTQTKIRKFSKIQNFNLKIQKILIIFWTFDIKNKAVWKGVKFSIPKIIVKVERRPFPITKVVIFEQKFTFLLQKKFKSVP